MTWAAVGAAAVGVVGGAIANSNKGSTTGGGAGTTTDTKTPWAAAQPWIMNNMAQGQALQQQYAAQPFNAQQQQAYANQYAQSDYMRNLVPSLLTQMQGEPLGYDPTKPNTKASAFNWDALLGTGGAGGTATGSMTAAQQAQDTIDAANRNKKPAKSDFTQQDANISDPMSQYWSVLRMNADPTQIQSSTGLTRPSGMNGGYGSFKYGDAMPQAGTQAYKDMADYFQYGGNDPLNYYGRAPSQSTPFSGYQNPANPYANRLGYMGGNSGASVSGSPAGDGSGGGNAGVF